MKKYMKFLTCFLIFVVLALSFYRPLNIKASATSIPVGLETFLYFLFNVGASTDVYNSSKIISSELSDEENQANAEAEQYYLQQMLEYYETYGGDASKISYMAADGSVVSLEKALQDATSMSTDDYIEMRKQSNSPTPTPGMNWGEIFINNAVGGLMDFLASFLNDEVDKEYYERPYTMYTGDNGYIDRSTGQFTGFIESDGVLGGKLVKGKYYYDLSTTVDISHASSYRMAIFISDNSNYRSGWNENGTSVGYGASTAVLGANRLEIYDVYYLSGSVLPQARMISYKGVYTYYNYLKTAYFPYACDGQDYLSFKHLSTNLPVFTDRDAMIAYLESGSGGSNAHDCNVRPQTSINALCNNYKNKVVSVNSVKSYGVTPTPTPSPTPKPTATPTPSPTPTPTPYPTWDKNSGNGNNFTNYNFYTEVSNSFVNVQTTLNNISQSVTNIYNFFQIDTQEISYQMNFDSPAYKFESVNKNINALKIAFGNDTYDVDTGLLKADYPKIAMKCPKILEPIVDTVGEDGKKEIVIVDFKDYALWFIRLRKFLEAIMWVGMVFLFMKEIKVVFTV